MKFGVREIVDVVFKATAEGQRIGDKTFKKYQPVFMIDTATTSSLEQATTSVYAQGGKGYNRLIAWEGEKTMTFTVTDALMSPMGLAVLTGAGLITPNKDNQTHVHTTLNVATDANGKATVSVDDLNEEYGLNAEDYVICGASDLKIYATELDGSGAGINWFDNITITAPTADANGYVHITKATGAGNTDTATFTINSEDAKNTTVQLDFYVIMNNSVTEVQIEPGSFGGYFYIEAQTLFRREDTGRDMAAEIIIPKAKVQSAFTFTMAASGDPSTFDFVMDAFPGYTRFDSTKKQMCVIQVVGDDKKATGETGTHTHDVPTQIDSPSWEDSPEPPTPVTTYTVTQTLDSNVTSSFSETTVNEGDSFTAVLTAASGYNVDDTSVKVSMGGTDIKATAYDASTDTISIQEVTGNIVIEAEAVAG